MRTPSNICGRSGGPIILDDPLRDDGRLRCGPPDVAPASFDRVRVKHGFDGKIIGEVIGTEEELSPCGKPTGRVTVCIRFTDPASMEAIRNATP